MNNYEGNYIIDKISNLIDGSTNKRESKLKGKEAYIPYIHIGNRMYIDYHVEGEVLHTSNIQQVKDYDDYLRVYTMNTLYQFKKVI